MARPRILTKEKGPLANNQLTQLSKYSGSHTTSVGKALEILGKLSGIDSIKKISGGNIDGRVRSSGKPWVRINRPHVEEARALKLRHSGGGSIQEFWIHPSVGIDLDVVESEVIALLGWFLPSINVDLRGVNDEEFDADTPPVEATVLDDLLQITNRANEELVAPVTGLLESIKTAQTEQAEAHLKCLLTKLEDSSLCTVYEQDNTNLSHSNIDLLKEITTTQARAEQLRLRLARDRRWLDAFVRSRRALKLVLVTTITRPGLSSVDQTEAAVRTACRQIDERLRGVADIASALQVKQRQLADLYAGCNDLQAQEQQLLADPPKDSQERVALYQELTKVATEIAKGVPVLAAIEAEVSKLEATIEASKSLYAAQDQLETDLATIQAYRALEARVQQGDYASLLEQRSVLTPTTGSMGCWPTNLLTIASGAPLCCLSPAVTFGQMITQHEQSASRRTNAYRYACAGVDLAWLLNLFPPGTMTNVEIAFLGAKKILDEEQAHYVPGPLKRLLNSVFQGAEDVELISQGQFTLNNIESVDVQVRHRLAKLSELESN